MTAETPPTPPLVSILRAQQPLLFDPNARNHTLTRHDIDALVTAVKTAVPVPHEALARALSGLARQLKAAVTRRGWTVAYLPGVANVPREPSRLASLGLGRETGAALAQHLAHHLALPQDPVAVQGQVLLSAMLHGGLVDQRWWPVFLAALGDPNASTRLGGPRSGRLALFLVAENKGPNHASSPTRTWFADPLTELLILRAERANCLAKPALPAAALAAFLGLTRLNAGRLAGLARTRFLLRVPGLVSAYAEGKLASSCLSPEAFVQVRANRPLAAAATANDTRARLSTAALAQTRSARAQRASPHAQYGWLRRAMRGANVQGRRARPGQLSAAIAAFLEEAKGEVFPIVAQLAGWCQWLLHSAPARSTGRSAPYAPGTVATYLSVVGPALVDLVVDEDVSEWDPEELADLYDQLIAQAPNPVEQGRRATALTLFHDALVATNPGRVLPLQVSGGGSSGQGRVDANLVTCAAYEGALARLSGSPRANALPRARRLSQLRSLALVLGYRAGLRWSETAYLCLNELAGDDETTELHVRINRYRRLKYNASKRIIPIGRLLSPDERALLAGVRAMRAAEAAALTGSAARRPVLLFADPAGAPLAADRLFNRVQQALREASGHPAATYHHARHAFASRLVAMLLLRAQPEAWGEMPGLRLDAAYARQVDAVRDWAIGATRSNRSLAYMLAMLIGHESATTTFASYVHVLSWLTAWACQSPDVRPRLDGSALRTLVPTGTRGVRLRPDESPANALGRCLDAWRRTDRPRPGPSVLPSVQGRAAKAAGMGGSARAKRTAAGPLPLMDWPQVHAILTAADPDSEVTRGSRRVTVAVLRARATDAAATNSALPAPTGLRPPHKAADQALVERIWALSAHDKVLTARWFADGLETFRDGYRKGNVIIAGRSVTANRHFLEFLLGLGLTKSQLRLVHFGPLGASAKTLATQRREWEKALGLPAGSCQSRGAGSHGNNRVGFRIMASGSAEQASYGAIYALMLLLSERQWK